MLYRTKSPIPKSKQIVAEKPIRPKAPEDLPILFKLTLIPGLKSIVLDEISKHGELKISEAGEEKIYLDYISDFKNILSLRSITNAYITKRGEKFNPYYICNHKSILGDLIEIVLGKKDLIKNTKGKKAEVLPQQTPKQVFKTFKLRCAGSDSKEVKEIQNYIISTYKLTESEDADLEIYISKPNELWELSVRLTQRPLSLRDYRVANIKGGLNPTIAYAMNSNCDLNNIQSYLNVFSGSGTLLIEAGLSNPNLNLIGFDIDGKSNALAIQNIKKAGLIKQIHLKTADIYNKPHLGKFDVIASDLPFGIQISAKENLDNLYKKFVEYCEETLNENGTLIAYTTEYQLLQSTLEQSKFEIIKSINLVISTSDVKTYLYPRIFVCKLK
jgi:16S rRNA G966 N2-methylase RsmD